MTPSSKIIELIAITKKVGKIVLDIYKTDFSIQLKADQSPLTFADQKAHNMICKELKKIFSNIPILSEEDSEKINYKERKNWPIYWCIDPLDGTKEFIKKNGEFTINIALIENNTPHIRNYLRTHYRHTLLCHKKQRFI